MKSAGDPFEMSLEACRATEKCETGSETADNMDSNVTHSSRHFRHSIPFNRVRKISNLNDSNVSSIMQVSFAHIPDSAPKLRSNSAFHGQTTYLEDAEEIKHDR